MKIKHLLKFEEMRNVGDSNKFHTMKISSGRQRFRFRLKRTNPFGFEKIDCNKQSFNFYNKQKLFLPMNFDI